MILRCVVITLLFLFFSENGWSQSVLDKPIDFSVENVKVNEALQKLSQELAINIAFSSNLFDDKEKRSYQFENESFRFVLETILEPYWVDYQLINDQVILSERPKRKFIINGFVEDSLSGERLIGANVFDKITGFGTVTNEYGFFSLELEEGEVSFTISYLGYRTYDRVIFLTENRELVVPLGPSLTLSEVVVVAKDSNEVSPDVPIGTNVIDVNRLKNLPTLGGEVDVMRMMDMMPGVQTGNDGLGGLHVRGGNPDQNLVLLDGVPVYNAGHMAGAFSMFSDFVIQNAELQKGNFDSRYGGRVSSIMDIRMREGDRRNFHGGFNLGPLAGKVFFEGPIQKEKSSFFIAGRRLFWDWLISPLADGLEINTPEEGDFIDYYFYDWNAKANFSISKKDKIFLSHFRGGDNLRFVDVNLTDDFGFSNDKQDIKIFWRNSITALRWNRLFNPKIFLNTTITYSRYNFDFWSHQTVWKENTKEFLDFRFDINNSKIQDVALRFDFDYYHNPQHLIKFGGAVKGQQFEARTDNLTRESSFFINNQDTANFEIFNNAEQLSFRLLPQKTPATELNLFAQDIFTPNKNVTLSSGLYIALFTVNGKIYTSLEPRLNAEFPLAKNFTMAASLTRMSQFLHQVSGSNIGLPSDLWVPATDVVRPQRAWQLSGGLHWNFAKKYHLGWEAYYKTMSGVLNFTTSDPLGVPSWEDKVTAGNGEAYGTEFIIEKTKGKTTGLIDYTWSWAWRKFDIFNDGEKFPFRYDRRHYLKSALMQEFSKKFSMSASWVYGTGNPFTLLESKFSDPFGEEFYIYSDRNARRLGAYHRLDISFNFTKKRKRRVRTWNISIFNVYNRRNPFLIYQEPRQGANQTFQYSILPLLPSFQYGLKW